MLKRLRCACFLLSVALLLPGCQAPTSEAPESSLPTLEQISYPLYPETLIERPDLPSPFTTADGVELITGYRDEDRTYTLIPVTVESGAGRNYRAGERGKGDQLDVDAEDFASLECIGRHSEAELDATHTITGRPIADITADGRPEALSTAGFLAADEDIISVLKGDNRLVTAMGLTHPELAKPLFNLWNILQLHDARMLDLGRPLQAVNRFWYNGHEVELMSASYGKGWQTSIFDDGNLGMWQIEVQRQLLPEEEAYLTEHYAGLDAEQMDELITCLSYIHTGEMVPFYIMRYGFYEGHTSYRADPIAIAFVFGLRSLEELDAAFAGDLSSVLAAHFNPATGTGDADDTGADQCALAVPILDQGAGRR